MEDGRAKITKVLSDLRDRSQDLERTSGRENACRERKLEVIWRYGAKNE